MDINITGNGTVASYVPPGRYIFTIGATTLDGAAVVTLKGGASDTGVGHIGLKDDAGAAILATGGAFPKPADINVAGYVSLVTTGYGTSAALVASFRRLPSGG